VTRDETRFRALLDRTYPAVVSYAYNNARRIDVLVGRSLTAGTC
jgi:hypothetical protein